MGNFLPNSTLPLSQVRPFGAAVMVGSWNMGDAVAPAALDAWIPREDKELADPISKFRDIDDWGKDMESFE